MTSVTTGSLPQDFVAGISFEKFRDNRLFFYAVTRALEIISEGGAAASQDLRNRHPQLPWRAIMGVGNVYRHNYDTVAEEYVWRTVHENLPALLAVVEAEIEWLDAVH